MTSYHANQLIATAKKQYNQIRFTQTGWREIWWQCLFHLYQQHDFNAPDHVVFSYFDFITHQHIMLATCQCGNWFCAGCRQWVNNMFFICYNFSCYILTCNCDQKVMMKAKTIIHQYRNFIIVNKTMWFINLADMHFKKIIKTNFSVVLEHSHNVCYVVFIFIWFYFLMSSIVNFDLIQVMLLSRKNLMKVWRLSTTVMILNEFGSQTKCDLYIFN